MAKFRMLHELLLNRNLIRENQVHQPLSVSRRDLERIHQRNYHQAFSSDTLSRPEQRRIGFPPQGLWFNALGWRWAARC